MDRFGDRIKTLIERTETLNEHVQSLSPTDNKLVRQALKELQIALEELQVAQEELSQQGEELSLANTLLEDEQQRYRELFEEAPDGYLLTDQNGHIVAANRAAAQLLNVPSARLIRKPIAVFVSPEVRYAFRIDLLKLLKMERRQDWEVQFTPRHSLYPVDVVLTVTTVRDAVGHPHSLRWMMRDITERKRDQEQLRVLNTELELRVSERTAELEKAVHLRDEFLSIAAHELRTPVTSLRGFAQTTLRLIDRELPPDLGRIRRAFEVMDAQAGKMAALIARLLDIARIESGHLVLDLSKIDLVQIVQNVISLAQVNVRGRSITLRGVPSAFFFGDGVRLEQVVTNLLDNAIKYSPENSPIMIDVAATGSEITLTVADQGPGIPPEERELIFTRFHRGPTSGLTGGLGLGLSICREIVQLYKGSLSTEFPAEGGSRFIVRLPTNLGESTT